MPTRSSVSLQRLGETAVSAISQGRAEMLRQLLMTDATDERLGAIRNKGLAKPLRDPDAVRYVEKLIARPG